MSTSDQDKAGSFSPFLVEEVVGDRRGGLDSVAAGLPDVAALAQMANEFFRALPGQAGQFGEAPSAVTVPGLAPQFGATPYSVPATPSADKLPSEADLQRFSGSGASGYQPEV